MKVLARILLFSRFSYFDVLWIAVIVGACRQAESLWWLLLVPPFAWISVKLERWATA